jgi:murein DD-endopeptidase MepM/ murein hydrolase activator NlpD
MRCVVEPGRSLKVLRLAVLASISVAAASCSSDTQRFDTNPYRARSSSGEVTGSVQQRHATIQSQPLPPPPSASAPQTRPVVVGTAGGSRGMSSYEPAPVAARPEITGSVQQTAAARQGWTWDGGTPIIVQRGDTIDGLVAKYGVPASAIAEANSIPNGAALKPGQHLVIPKLEATGSAPPRVASLAHAPTPAPQIAAPATSASIGGGQHVHVVAPGETLMALSRKYHKSLAEIARANNIAPGTMVKVGDRIVIPGVVAPLSSAAPAAATKVASASKVAAPWGSEPKPAPAPAQKVASLPAAAPTAAAINPTAQDPEPLKVKTDVTAALPKFRWPVNGRVIAAFGPKPSGQQNDGINVAVPEGTPIKAAEDGVVAYAGSELKTYGNLVLVRHANGYVTAYAHASEILVKRDDPVKRGQIIAKAGQTGNVAAPQLHFEIRKGSSPVDPAPFLDKGGDG